MEFGAGADKVGIDYKDAMRFERMAPKRRVRKMKSDDLFWQVILLVMAGFSISFPLTIILYFLLYSMSREILAKLKPITTIYKILFWHGEGLNAAPEFWGYLMPNRIKRGCCVP